MNIADLSRLLNETNEDVKRIINNVVYVNPQAKTRLTENLTILDSVLDAGQKKEIQLVIDLINNSTTFKASKDAENI